MIVEISENEFDDIVLNSEKPVLVDFWAPWCIPCKKAEPVVEEISKEFSDRLKVVKINIDDNKAIADTYGIESIPTVKIFYDGGVVDTVVGLRPVGAMSKTINNIL